MEPSDPNPREADRLIFAGLLGLAVAGVFQMMEKGGELDIPQQVAVYAFALAAPLLAVGLITDYARRAGKMIPKWHDIIVVVGGFSSVIGFGALFFHFGFVVGVIFAGGCILGLLLVRGL